ncbi:hypothetical protein FS749_002267 [Ceratobasidium sp. UAMH 11750]|nr:hypothetical protein FS749_002267 [Ceratobasidium sp. UAMH 11750]
MHTFGNYPTSIKEIGTTDLYSTQIGELQNCKYKAQYVQTNKHNTIKQMTEIGDIMAALQDIDKGLQASFEGLPVIDSGAIDSLVSGQPYFVGQKELLEDSIPNIPMWIAKQSHDIVVKFFLPQLKQDLLGRIQGTTNHTDFSDSKLTQVDFHRGQMFQHKTLHVNYTSYNVLHQQDTLNNSLNFIDPSNILRATDLIPNFHSNTTEEFLGQPALIACGNKDFGDWKGYYVNRFVNCDMLMWYVGGGVGHYQQSTGTTTINVGKIQDPGVNENTEVNEDHEDGGTGEYKDEIREGELDMELMEGGEDGDKEEQDEHRGKDIEEDGDDDSVDISQGDDVEDDALYGF